MSTVSGTRRASRRQSQDGSADKVVVNLDASSPVVGSHRGVSTSSAGAQTSPIDVEALEDEVHAVSPSRAPPQNKRRRVAPIIHLSPETGEASSLQSNNAVKTSKAPAKVAPKEPIFTCPVCWNKLEEPSATICGHIFFTNCIQQAIQFQKKCPTCRKSLKKNNFHCIYLPNSVG